ncbi:MAG: sensor histidine kinase, partial [Asticcacaulis sp.]
MANIFPNIRRFDLFSLNIFRPNFFRQTPFRLTLVFLAVYVFVAALVFGYVWFATTQESRAWGNVSVDARVNILRDLDQTQGHADAVAKLLNDDATEWLFAKGAFDGS